MLNRLMCLTVGHDLVRETIGIRTCGRCLRCGHVTPGWVYGESAALVPGTQPYWDEIYKDCMDVELSLHGGG